MNQDTFVEKLNAEPFEPFVVVTNSDDRYEIRHPEMAKVAPRRVYIFRPVDERGWVEEPTIIGLHNISALAPITGEAG